VVPVLNLVNVVLYIRVWSGGEEVTKQPNQTSRRGFGGGWGWVCLASQGGGGIGVGRGGGEGGEG